MNNVNYEGFTLYKITRFSNVYIITNILENVYTLTKLQGSQTFSGHPVGEVEFYTLTKLQGSQTFSGHPVGEVEFYTLTKLQGSQT